MPRIKKSLPQSTLGQAFLLWCLFVARGDDEIDAATHIVMAGYGHPFRTARAHHIVEDDVGDVFVEVAFVTKTP